MTMRLELSSPSRVLVDLRATGLLRGVGHAPTLSVRLDRAGTPLAIDAGDGVAMDTPIVVRVAAADIEPPADVPAADRDKMRENMLGPEVLDVARFPNIDFRGRSVGSLEGATLSGDLEIRGSARPISMRLRGARDPGHPSGSSGAAKLAVHGAWEGRLTDLGIKPYRALLGALRLDDWIRIRLEALFAVR
jgi:YceI-like domain